MVRYSLTTKSPRTRAVGSLLFLAALALVLPLIVGFLAANALGQAPDELSLDQAIARALQHHPMIQTQKARVDAFAAEITQARSARFPQI
ncbi:MAG TPA: TolC family protein, partial [Acidobacteriota bacterium]